MRAILILAVLSLTLAACSSLREKAIAANNECKARTFANQQERMTCYDEQERPIFSEVSALSHAYGIFHNKRWMLAYQFDNRKITADQYKVALNDNTQEFLGKFLQHEANEKAKDAKRWDDARKVLATGLAAYGEAKYGRAKSGEKSKPKTTGGTMPGLVAIYKGETVSGLNKICLYDRAGSAVAVTVASHELCPMNPD